MNEKKIVLSIDDSAVQHSIFQNMLTPRYDLRTVNSASNALNYLNNHKVDVILLDIEMPNVSGFDFLYDIRKIPSYMDVPIIIVSGKIGREFLNEAKNSSAFAVLAKPVEPKTLVETIEDSLAAKRK